MFRPQKVYWHVQSGRHTPCDEARCGGAPQNTNFWQMVDCAQLPLITRSVMAALCWSLVAVLGQPAVGDEGVVILPQRVVLSGPNAAQRLLVERSSSENDRESGDEYVGQVTEGVQLASENPEIARIEDGVVRPVADGTTTITAKVGDQVATSEVIVRQMAAAPSRNFRNDVLAVFAKAGCNSGACHGALAGKGGFKLSLRGYDPMADHFAITREARGRRIEVSDPGRSLILAKPSGAISHKGGLRFEVDSPEYAIIADWIAAGAKSPRDDDPMVERIEVLPERVSLRPDDRQQILVRAHYSDGRVADVTRWTKFSSANESVAGVDDDGRVAVVGHGEGAVVAWFASKIAIAHVTVSFENDLQAEQFASFESRNFIDDHVLAQLRRLNLPPSSPADDATFMRRAFLDTIGTLPTAAEVRRYLADSSADKRKKLVESLLEREEFVDYWAYKWSDLLLVNGQRLRPAAVKAYYEWIRTQVDKNVRWDEMARQIVTARGSSIDQGETNFYALHQDAETMAENVCQAFMGLSIGCAKCHNHPLEKWTNDQYYGMANLFARVRAKGWGGEARNGNGRRTLFVSTKGDLVQPLTGKPQAPTPLDGEPLPFDSPNDRRLAVADWLTSPENPYFARAIANRVWANFFGTGIVEPIDDLRVSNPASNERLLSAAADFLVEHDFDLKALMRAILQSSTYALSSRPLPENEAETHFYSHYYPRRLMAEVLHDAIVQVTGVPTAFTQIEYAGADFQDTDAYKKGTRALELYDAAVVSRFLKSFGRNPRNITCECERSNEPSMVQVLHLSNGKTINQKLAAEQGRVQEIVELQMPAYRTIEEVYLSALSRYPTDQEMQELLPLLAGAPAEEKRVVVEDLFWSVLSSREFLFQH